MPDIEERIVLAIFRNIVNQLDPRGHFLTYFAKAVVQADLENLKAIMPAAQALIVKYDLEANQRKRGILHAAQYM